MANVSIGTIQTQSVINTILQRCIAEKNNKDLTIPIDRVEERVSFYTGITKNLIVELIDGLQTDDCEHRLSFHHRILIIKGLLHFYGINKLPTVNEIYNLLLKQTMLPPFTQFSKEMANLGYCYRKTTKGYLLMEDPALTFERFYYLKKLLKFRSNNTIIHYMDERIIDEHFTFPKPTKNMNEKTLIKSLLYCYLVSSNGMIEGIFCNYINCDEIMNWIKHIVMPSLQPSSVIVIRNSFLYGQETNNPPSPYASKDTMLKWLRTNNIPCNNNMRKADLYALITKLPPTGESRKLDFLFKAHGHEVLRLPTSMQELTPTEKAWQDMKLDLQDKELPDLFAVKEYVHNYFKTVIPLVHKWSEYEKNIEEIEQNVFDLDEAIENVLDSYNFETGDPLFECQLTGNVNSVMTIDLE